MQHYALVNKDSILTIFTESLKCPYYLRVIALLGTCVKEIIKDAGEDSYIRIFIIYSPGGKKQF